MINPLRVSDEDLEKMPLVDVSQRMKQVLMGDARGLALPLEMITESRERVRKHLCDEVRYLRDRDAFYRLGKVETK